MAEETIVPVPLNGVLDLHTFRPGDVKRLIPDYIEACHQNGVSEIRIIHGKGRGTMRRIVEAILVQHPLVSTFRRAGEPAGGWGATLVTLVQPGAR